MRKNPYPERHAKTTKQAADSARVSFSSAPLDSLTRATPEGSVSNPVPTIVLQMLSVVWEEDDVDEEEEEEEAEAEDNEEEEEEARSESLDP